MMTFRKLSRSAHLFPNGGLRTPALVTMMLSIFLGKTLPGMVVYTLVIVSMVLIASEGFLCSRKVWRQMAGESGLDRVMAVIGIVSLFGFILGISGIHLLDVPTIKAYRLMPEPLSSITQGIAFFFGIIPFALSFLGFGISLAWITVNSLRAAFSKPERL